jgi:hypothetical protein
MGLRVKDFLFNYKIEELEKIIEQEFTGTLLHSPPPISVLLFRC